MKLLTLSQFAKEINCTPASVTYWKNLGVLDQAFIYQKGKKKPFINVIIGKELIRKFKDPAFGKNSLSEQVKGFSKKQTQEKRISNNSASKNSPSSLVKNEAMKAPQSKTEIDLELLFEIVDIVYQVVKEREEFLKPITNELIEIAKSGNLRKLRSEITRRVDLTASNIWLCFKINIDERYGTDLLGIKNES